jgi:hypothetical protein
VLFRGSAVAYPRSARYECDMLEQFIAPLAGVGELILRLTIALAF